MKNHLVQPISPASRIAVARCTVAFKTLAHLAFVAIVLILVNVPAKAAATGTKQKDYPHNFDAVWTATIGALQGHGDPIIYSDKQGGIITTGFKAEEDEEWHHKFNLLFVRNGEESTNISVTCNVESLGNHGLTWKDERSDGTRETQLLESIARRLQPSGAAEDVSESNCRANFSVKGSIVRGTTFSSFDEFSALNQTTAVDALIASILRASLSLVNTDKNNGTVSATGQSASGKPYPLDFSVVPISGGVRVSAVRKLSVGVHANEEPVREQLCKVISGVAQATRKAVPVKTSSPPIAAPADSTSIEDRLRKLDDLHRKGLITDDEYKKKRAELLSHL